MKQIRGSLNFYLLTNLLLLIVLAKSAPAQKQNASRQNKPGYNVLFLFIDDLRPELGCYGSKEVRSPHIDRLASAAMVFKKHFVTVPTCGPSRACLLTGKRPRTVDELSNDVLQIKQEAGLIADAPESFVHHLRLNGYYTVGMGKISHSPDGYIYKYLEKKGSQRELPRSWDEMLFNPGKWGTGWNAFFGYADGSNRNALKNQVKPYEGADVSDEGYPDGLTTSLLSKSLMNFQSGERLFSWV